MWLPRYVFPCCSHLLLRGLPINFLCFPLPFMGCSIRTDLRPAMIGQHHVTIHASHSECIPTCCPRLECCPGAHVLSLSVATAAAVPVLLL